MKVFYVLISSILLLGCQDEGFNKLSFRGTSPNGKLVSISVSSKNGKVEGYGFHRGADCEINEFEIKGVDKDGLIEFDELEFDTGQLYGMVEAVLDKSDGSFSYEWTDGLGGNPVSITLEESRRNAKELLAILPECKSAKPNKARKVTRASTPPTKSKGIFEAVGGALGKKVDEKQK